MGDRSISSISRPRTGLAARLASVAGDLSSAKLKWRPVGSVRFTRIVPHERVQVAVASCEPDGILDRPAAGEGVIVARAETHQPGFRIVQTAAVPDGWNPGAESATTRPNSS